MQAVGTAVGRRDLGEAVEGAGVEWRGQGGSATPVDSEFCPWGVRPIQTPLGPVASLKLK